MGFTTGGFIIKKKEILDNEILELLGKKNYSVNSTVNMEEATSNSFYGIGIGRIDDLTFILSRDLPHSFSFEGVGLSKVEKQFEQVSKNAEILCFLINSIAETYAWSIFKNGEKIRIKFIEGTHILFDEGPETEYETKVESNDDGMVRLIENFTNLTFLDILFEKKIVVNAYYKSG